MSMDLADARAQAEASSARGLRRELEAARQALRLQTARCRHVDAALSRRIDQKELEVRNWKSLRDEQLAQVMRALTVLEARLRREQRTIRSQLGERDALIRAQQLEIARLRKALDQGAAGQEEATKVNAEDVKPRAPEVEFDCDVKPDLISSLGISHPHRLTPTTDEDSQSNLDSLQLSFYELGSQPESLVSNLSTQSGDADEPVRRSPPEAFKESWSEASATRVNNNNNYCVDLKSLKCIDASNCLKKLEVKVHVESHYPLHKNVLSPVKEEGSVILSACSSPARCNPCEDQVMKTPQQNNDKYKDCKPSPSTLLQEVRITGRNEYEDNPVLNCVNQILLRDQEEFLEEQRVLRLKEQEKSKKEIEAKLNNKKLTKSTENLSFINEQLTVQHSPVKTKVYPLLDGVIAHHVTEQVIKLPQEDFQDNRHKALAHMANSKQCISAPENVQCKTVVPPALPPKPQRLVLSKPLDQKTLLNSILPQLNGEESDTIDTVKKRASLPNPSSDNELYVISNSAIDDDILQQLQGRRIKSCSELPATMNNSNRLSQSKESMYTPTLSHPTHKPHAKHVNSNSVQKDKSSDLKPPKKSPQPKDEDASRYPSKHSPSKKILSPSSCIKVASPVSSLLNSVDNIESPSEEPSKKTSPSVSQIVKRFENLGAKEAKESEEKTEDEDNLQKNFEEFRLDECDMEALCGNANGDGNGEVDGDGGGDGRPEGDGAETRLSGSAAALEARISYENFLEATGLSQKSIMTPSRLFSNHKSVMKPKDVKHRSRVKAAAATGPTVRYWTEPFL